MLPLRRVTASRVRSDLGYTLHVFEGVGSAIVVRVHVTCSMLTYFTHLPCGFGRGLLIT